MVHTLDRFSLLYILDTNFLISLFSRQFTHNCPLIWARNDLKTPQKKKNGDFYFLPPKYDCENSVFYLLLHTWSIVKS